jgi:hypothetical protein
LSTRWGWSVDDKIIVSNRAALKAKYGGAGLTRIKNAVDALIAADAKRGTKSRLVYLDEAAAMKSFNEDSFPAFLSVRCLSTQVPNWGFSTQSLGTLQSLNCSL